jgi:glycosyltransferase involved in cell wall biosynthesis
VGMKVLMIGAYPLEPGVVHGGIESVTSTLVPALAERDDIDSVTVLRFHYGDASTDYRREGPKVEVYYVRGQARLRTITGSFLDRRKARRLVAQLNPDVVHGQEIGLYGDIAVRCSPNCVVTVHGITYAENSPYAESNLWDRLRDKSIRSLERRVLRRAKVVISISKFDTEELDEPIQGTRVSIANPTATEFFALAPSGPTEPRLLFAGMVTPLKNPVGLVNAFAQARRAVPEARLAIIGPQPDPRYTQTVRDRVAALGLAESVDIIGLVDIERLRREIVAARAVVLFSRQENAPTIIAQAMAAGKPVVGTRVGGVPEMVDDGVTGFVVESEDEATLADRLRTLLDDQDLCLRMGRRAHEVARARFAPEEVARLTAEAYRTAQRLEGMNHGRELADRYK